jgi:hypothetical protein
MDVSFHVSFNLALVFNKLECTQHIAKFTWGKTEVGMFGAGIAATTAA